MPTVTAQQSFDIQPTTNDSSEEIITVDEENNPPQSENPTKPKIFNLVKTNTDSAFQILNQDYLAPITKPNAIVRPLRRGYQNNESPTYDSGGQQFEILGNASHGLLPTSQTVNKEKDTKNLSSSKHGPFENFSRELESKLRRLQKDVDGKITSKNGSNQDALNRRPLFITTVPRGLFLPPEKDLPSPPKRIYAFSSRPRVFANRDVNYSNDKLQLNRSSEKDTFSVKNYAQSYASRMRDVLQQQQHQTGEPFKNLMYDKRVIRGSNYSQSQYISSEPDIVAIKEAESRRRQYLRRRVTRNQRGIIGTPPPVYGRKHENVQTEKYLEELFDKPIECDASAQTDLFLQRPPSPPFVPAKIGVDVATEILEGELFDFDVEVSSILETLIGRTVEQGLVEVMHEEEIADMKKQQEEFLVLREADRAELRRLEAEEIRLQAEKERRLRQENIAKELDAKMDERITAAKLLQGHVADMIPDVLKQIEPLTDVEDRQELERKLGPWISEQVADEIGQIIDSREILTEIVKTILKERSLSYGVEVPQDEENEEENVTAEEHINVQEHIEEMGSEYEAESSDAN